MTEKNTNSVTTPEALRLSLKVIRAPDIAFSTGFINTPECVGQLNVSTAISLDKEGWKTIFVFLDATMEPKIENHPLPEAFKLRYRIAAIWESEESFKDIPESQLADYMVKRSNLELFPVLRDRVHFFLASVGVRLPEAIYSAPNTALVDIKFVDHKI